MADAIIARYEAYIQDKCQRIAALEAENAALREQLAEVLEDTEGLDRIILQDQDFRSAIDAARKAVKNA